MSDGKKEILLGDCLELMKDIPNGSIDMILCDLPYGTTKCKWDNIIPFDKLWEQYNRIIKPNGVVVLFGAEPFSSLLRRSNINGYKYDWVWVKSIPIGFLNVKKMPLKNTELISIFYNNQPTYNPQGVIKINKKRINDNSKNGNNKTGLSGHNGGKMKGAYIQEYTNYPTQILNFSSERGLHPTQKPIELFEYLIKTYTNEGDLVLDNTAGSGTTAIACLNTNRQFIVMEKDFNYFEKIKERVGDFNKKFEPQTLFGNEM